MIYNAVRFTACEMLEFKSDDIGDTVKGNSFDA